MNIKKNVVLGLLLSLSPLCGYASSSAANWGYSENDGPKTWGNNYPECSKGRAQSPIDIGMIEADSGIEKNISFHYKDGFYTAHTDGKVKYYLDELNKNNYLVLDNDKYYLKQFHFHTPSEHSDDGELYPFTIHFVHQSENGKYAVLGVLGVEDSRSKMNTLEQLMKDAVNAKPDDTFVINVSDLLGSLSKGDIVPAEYNPATLPLSSSIKYYSGSFTTPPCTEGVSWLVTQGKAKLTKEAIENLRNIIGTNNNRPTQDINGREYTPVNYK